MPLIVEDGTQVIGANSYLSLADALTYFQNIGADDVWTGASYSDANRTSALIRATRYIDQTYYRRYPGYRTPGPYGSGQGLEWPRVGAYQYLPDDGRDQAYFQFASGYGYRMYDQGYTFIPPNVIPPQIKFSVAEGAIRELIDPGSLTPDLDRGGAIKQIKAGDTMYVFQPGAPATTTFQTIVLALESLLMPNPVSGRLRRG